MEVEQFLLINKLISKLIVELYFLCFCFSYLKIVKEKSFYVKYLEVLVDDVSLPKRGGWFTKFDRVWGKEFTCCDIAFKLWKQVSSRFLLTRIKKLEQIKLFTDIYMVNTFFFLWIATNYISMFWPPNNFILYEFTLLT